MHQVDLDDPHAPLLPPDHIYESKDISVDGTPRTTTYTNVAKARSEFQRLRFEKSSVRRHRKFVFGAMHENLYDGYFLVDPLSADFDLKVRLTSATDTMIKVRMVTQDSHANGPHLLASTVALGRSKSGPGNARGVRVGDVGAMHAIGYKCASTKEIYKNSDVVASKVKLVSGMMRDWMEDNLPEELSNILSIDKGNGVASALPFMPVGPGSKMMLSVNLGNSAHYDTGDTSESVALWVEEKPGVSKNWYFVLPNVSHEGSFGVVIKLCHGAVICWDGRQVYHCTSKTDVGSNNKTYGCMWGSSRL